ncbi:MAG: carbohydrate ABC transporter permease [Actinobacteria bacterium]|nr:carbohydrate ABC transporter permease [Actinomycetota bacterium]
MSLLLHGSLVLATIIAIFPVFWIAISSFKSREEIQSSATLNVWPDTWLWSNYSNVVKANDYGFLRWFGNSILIALLTVVVGVFLSATAGYALSRYRFPGYRSALNSFLITQMFPAAILMVPIYQIITSLKLVDSNFGLLLALASTAVPFCVWMLKGYFDTIPISIEEAGKLDGLTPFGTFWRIVMPLSLPGLAVTCFYTFITAWNEVAFANIILLSPEKYTLPVGLRTYVFQFDQAWEKLTAGAIIVTIPAVLVFLFAQRYLVSGLTRGGVKG